MTRLITRGRLHLLQGAALAVLALAAAAPVQADEMAWRQSSVRTETQGASYIRRGVAMFANNEPATITFWGTFGPAEGARAPFIGRMTIRFEDQSSFTFESEGAVETAGANAGTMTMKGKLVAGTGRFAGIQGTVEMKGRTGLDPTGPGAFGDIFAEGRASYTIRK